jgi:pantetheine-phosphate adenylyltransferase
MEQYQKRASRACRALIPGSFDPITLGHLNVIRRASAMFDEVVVAVMTNDMRAYVATATSKQYLFRMEERQRMVALACEDIKNVWVIASTARLIDLFDTVDASIIVKGVRNEADYLYEQKHALWNRGHNPRAETVYLPADEQFDAVSSTRVRQAIENGAPLDDLVPAAVAQEIEKILAERRR